MALNNSSHYNGEIQDVKRVYNSLDKFMAEDRVYPYGHILCVSTRNNENYDTIIEADGVNRFSKIWNEQKEGCIKRIAVSVEDNNQTLRVKIF